MTDRDDPEAIQRYRSRSLWLDTVPDPLTPRPALAASIDADVAIVGAGLTGLWTAYELLGRAPDLRVAIVEAEIAAAGGRVVRRLEPGRATADLDDVGVAHDRPTSSSPGS